MRRGADLADPEVLLRGVPALGPYEREDLDDDTTRKAAWLADLARHRSWHELGEIFGALVEKTHRTGLLRLELRFLAGELAFALHAADADRIRRCRYNLALRHRLLRNWFTAEAHSCFALREPLTEDTALWHVRALRELSAVANQSDPAAAEEHAQRALRICADFRESAVDLRQAETEALLELSAALRLQARFGQAGEALELARERATGLDSPILLGMINGRLGALQLMKGRPDEALTAFYEAYDYFLGVSPRNAAYAAIREISCLYQLGDDEGAVEASERALRLVDELGDPQMTAQVLLERGRALRGLGSADKAVPLFARVRHLYGDPFSLETGRAWLEEARALRTTGADEVRVLQPLAEVLALAGRRGEVNLAVQALTECLGVSEDPDGLRLDRPLIARWAVAGAETVRADLVPVTDRAAVQRQQHATYTAALWVEAHEGDVARAVSVMELGRADAIGYLLARHDTAPADLFSVPRSTTVSSRHGLMDWVSRFAEFLAGRNPAPPDEEPEIGAEDTGSAPAPGTLISTFHLLDSRTVATAWRADGATDWKMEMRDIPHHAAELVKTLCSERGPSSRGVLRQTWSELAQVILPPARAVSECAELVLSPDPRLWQVPYPALPLGDGYLIDYVRLVVVPSLRCLRLLSSGSALTAGGRAATILDDTLAAAPVEQAALAGWAWGRTPLTGLEDDRLSEAGLLYISGHGFRPGSNDTFRMSFEALAGARLPPLAVLTSCWSATSVGRWGEDPFSLAVAALLGGARTVIAGTGEVGDAGTAHIMARTLPSLAAGVPVAAALRDAQIAVRDAHPGLGPYEWGGLLTVGPGDTAFRPRQDTAVRA